MTLDVELVKRFSDSSTREQLGKAVRSSGVAGKVN